MSRVTVKHPKESSPIDLGEELLADLAHLFFVEGREWCDDCGAYHARDEVESMNRIAISKELCYFSHVARKRRLGDVDRNLAPWETMAAAEQVRAYRRRFDPDPR